MLLQMARQLIFTHVLINTMCVCVCVCVCALQIISKEKQHSRERQTAGMA